MLRKKYRQAVMVESVEEYNETMKRLADKSPEDEIKLTDSGRFMALIRYEEEEEICETVRDEYLQRGKQYYCKQCPLHAEITDRRKTWVDCSYSRDGETRLNNICCDIFYQALDKGAIEPLYEIEHKEPWEKERRFYRKK